MTLLVMLALVLLLLAFAAKYKADLYLL